MIDDLISRRAALDAISCNITVPGRPVTGRQNAKLVAATIGAFADRIKALPSAQPEPQWIPIKWHECTNKEREEYGFSKDIVAVFDNEMPNDEQKILVTTSHGYVEKRAVCRMSLRS